MIEQIKKIQGGLIGLSVYILYLLLGFIFHKFPFIDSWGIEETIGWIYRVPFFINSLVSILVMDFTSISFETRDYFLPFLSATIFFLIGQFLPYLWRKPTSSAILIVNESNTIPAESKPPLVPVKANTIAASILLILIIIIFFLGADAVAELHRDWSFLSTILYGMFSVFLAIAGIVLSILAWIRTKSKRFKVFLVAFIIAFFLPLLLIENGPVVDLFKSYKINLYNQKITEDNAKLDAQYRVLYDKLAIYLATPKIVKDTASSEYLILEDNTVVEVLSDHTKWGFTTCSIPELCDYITSKTPIKIELPTFDDFKSMFFHKNYYGDNSSGFNFFDRRLYYNDVSGLIKTATITTDLTGQTYDESNINPTYGMIPGLVYINGKLINLNTPESFKDDPFYQFLKKYEK